MPTHLTDDFVRDCPAPPRGQVQIKDDEATGLCLRVTPKARTFYYCYEIRKNGLRVARAFRLGVPRIVAGPSDPTHFMLKEQTYPLTVAGMRRAVTKLRGMNDPYLEIRGEAVKQRDATRAAKRAERAQADADRRAKQTRPTFAEAVTRYIDTKEARGKLKPRTAREYRRLLEKEIAPCIGAVPVADLATAHADRLYQRTRTRPTTGNRCQQLARAVLAWSALSRQQLRAPSAPNVFDGDRWHVEKLTRRWLTPEEEARLLHALETAIAAATGMDRNALEAIRFLSLSGWRKGEAFALRWDAIDWDAGVVTLEDSKTGQSVRPLGDDALALLRAIRDGQRPRRAYVFPSPVRPSTHREDVDRAWNKIRTMAGIDHPLHALRHTRATRTLTATGSIEATRVLAGHRDERTTRRYAEFVAAAARKAANATDAHIAAQTPEPDPKVIPLRRTQM
jgi:integrase